MGLNPDSRNPEPRKLFDKVVDHYRQGLASLNPRQLLLNVDGVAGSGKTYTIMQISVILQEIAWLHNRKNPLQALPLRPLLHQDDVSRTNEKSR
jgi:hypothetical protein